MLVDKLNKNNIANYSFKTVIYIDIIKYKQNNICVMVPKIISY